MSTVMRRKESEVQLIFKNFRISVMGQCPERAYMKETYLFNY